MSPFLLRIFINKLIFFYYFLFHSKLDIHAMNYCLVVNTVQPVKSLCKVMMPSYGSFKYNISDNAPGKTCEKFFMIERFIALPTKIEKISNQSILLI